MIIDPDSITPDFLVVIASPRHTTLGQSHSLVGVAGPVTIGRGSQNTLVLDDAVVSRSHLRLEPRADGWWVVDCHSTNGTFVNDRPVTSARLGWGDTIRIGETIFRTSSPPDDHERYNPTPLDGLTQLYNRRHLLQRLDAELQRRRTEPTRPLSLVMIDIDHFKRLNDVHGHGTGDTILQALAPLAAIYAGPGGLAARHGGEEFALLLPGVDGPEAAARADMFRAEVAGHTFLLDGQTITFTVSAGVAQADDRTHTAESLLTQVDEKLYEAKRGGRNRVVR